MYKPISGVWLGLLLLGTAAQAQLTLSVQEPPAGVVQQSQLWNLALAYGGNQTVTVTIGLSIFDVNDNQPLLTAYTSPIVLHKGMRQLKAADVAPVNYSYLSIAFTPARQPGGFIPIGQYRACYTVYSGDREAETVLAEDCINLEVVPLAPPELAMPADSSTVETAYPAFTWLPPAPATLFSDLNYDVIIAEVMPGQSPESAIQENLPVYSANRLSRAVFNYPASYKGIDTGKLYAWRVIAKNGAQFAAQSEVWAFSRSPNAPAALTPAGGRYLELKTGNEYAGTGVLPNNILGIKYYSYDKPHETTIRLLDQKGASVQEYKRTIVYGNNFLVFLLGRGLSRETTYFIELTDLQQARCRASFRMSK